MTARRSTATERRGSAVPPRRPTAILLAVAVFTVGTAAVGCASRTTGPQLAARVLTGPPTPLPSGSASTHPTGPPSTHPGKMPAQVPLTTPFTTASTSFPPPANSYPDDTTAWHAM